MLRYVSLIAVWLTLGNSPDIPICAAALDQPVSPADASRERVELRDHSCYSGLIESEDDDWLTMIRIQSPRGQQMHLVIQPLDKNQILSISRLDAGKRAELVQQIDEFRNRATIEALRMEAIRLKTHEGEGYKYHHFDSKWFTLDSTADDENTRRVIVRAEQIFSAYRQIVLPRTEPAHPPRLIVLGSMDQYQSLLAKLGLKTVFENPACYLEEKNVVVVGSDLARLAAVTGQTTAQNAQLRKDLSALEGRLNERLRTVAASLRKSGSSNEEIAIEVKRVREKFKRQLESKRDELRQSDQQIERLFKQSANQTLVRLYHEAFHAYLRNNVYPRQKYDVPPWLNEGLAVIFEGGLLEGNTLRVDSRNPIALKKLKADLDGPSPMALTTLLSAGEKQFLLTARVRPDAVDRYYVYAWGLAYYLTFQKHLLGSPALEKYLQTGSAQIDPAQRFARLTGMPPAQFEIEWRTYIRGLGAAATSSVRRTTVSGT